MQSLKRYFPKIAILLTIIGSMVFLYWYIFHKNFDQQSIPQNADGIAMVDVKNIRNYLAYTYLKNPSEWRWKGVSSKFKKHLNLADFGLKTTDYLAFFHIENQPLNHWFIALQIDDETVFEKTMIQAHFQKTKFQNGMVIYYSNTTSVCIIKHSNRILVANISEKQKQTAVKVAEDMFLKKLFLDANKTKKTINTPNAITIWLKKNSLLEEDGIININLKQQEITAEGILQLRYKKESHFSQTPNALLSFGFDFEMIRKQNFLQQHSAQINKLIGFDLDSILVHQPTKTELLLQAVIEKKDSVISYDYDDDFNPVKKVVVHTNREPSFSFSVETANSTKIYNYLKTQNAIDSQNIFVNFPFAETKALVKEHFFILKANPLKKGIPNSSSTKNGYLQIYFNKLHPKEWRFIIAKNKNFEFLKSFESLKLDISTKNSNSFLEMHLKTKEGKNLISVLP